MPTYCIININTLYTLYYIINKMTTCEILIIALTSQVTEILLDVNNENYITQLAYKFLGLKKLYYEEGTKLKYFRMCLNYVKWGTIAFGALRCCENYTKKKIKINICPVDYAGKLETFVKHVYHPI